MEELQRDRTKCGVILTTAWFVLCATVPAQGESAAKRGGFVAQSSEVWRHAG